MSDYSSFVHVQNIDQKHRSSQHKKCLPFICCYHKWNTVQPTTTMPSCFLQLCIMHFMNPYFVEVQSIHMSSATRVQRVASASKHQVPLHCSCNWKNADLRSWKIVNHSFLCKVSGLQPRKVQKDVLQFLFITSIRPTSLWVFYNSKNLATPKDIHASLVTSQTPNSQPRTHANASHDNCQVE